MSLKYGDIPIVDETLDLCDLVTQIDKQCPLKQGKFPINIQDIKIPDYVPSVSNDTLTYCTGAMNYFTGKIRS